MGSNPATPTDENQGVTVKCSSFFYSPNGAVYLWFKPKVKAFGFNKKELMSVAAKIADNLTFADDVSDEDVKHKPILAEYIETESGKKSNSPQLLAALAMYRKTNSILIVAKLFCVVMFGLINVNILYYSFSTLYQMCNLRQSL